MSGTKSSSNFSATPPALSLDMLQGIEKAREFARTTQSVYRSLLQKAKQEEPSPAPYPYPQYSLPPSIASKTQDNSAQSSTNVLQLHNLSILSRVYVGSIHFELTEHDLRAAFSTFGPIRSISLSIEPMTLHHKGFCFIEYETPEAAALALETMNGGELGGRSLKVGRPVNFPPELPPGVPRPLGQRLYIANVHECVSEADIREIFSAFGTLISVSLIPDLERRMHKGYGYVEFEEPSSAQLALISLKGFKLGGLELKVGKTVVGGAFPEGMAILDRMPAALRRPKDLPQAVLQALKGINMTIAQATGSATTQ